MRKLLTSLALACLAPLAWAGTDASNARGFVPGKVYDFGDFDSVNAFNGNLVVQLPMGPTYPVGPDLDFGLTLTYNSQPWDFTNYSIIWTGAPTWFGLGDSSGPDSVSEGHPADLNNAGLGWRVSLGELLEPATGPNQPQGSQGNPVPPTNDEQSWVYVGPDGAAHRFFGNLYSGQSPVGVCSGGTPIGKCFTSDGSFLRLSQSTQGPQVEFPNGVRQVFTHTENGIWRPARIFDRFGNEITVDYSTGPTGAAVWTIRDNAVSNLVQEQRTQIVRFEPDPSDVFFDDGRERERIDEIVMEGPNGPISFDFHYTADAIAPTCTANSFLTKEWGTSLLTGVTQSLAGGDQWDYHFTYVPDDTNVDVNPDYPCSYIGGRLKTLELPTGGIVEYDYTSYFMGVNYCREPGSGQGPGPHIPPAANSLRSFPGVGQRLYKNSIADPDEAALSRWDYLPISAWYSYVTPICTGLDPWLHIMTRQYEMLGNSLVSRTESYFGIWALEFDTTNSEGWRQTEFGLPFTRRRMGPGAPYQDPDLPNLVNPFVVNGKEHYLSQLVFRCPIEDRELSTFDGYPATPLGEVVRHDSCEPERARYVRYEASFGECSLEDGSCGNIGYRVAGSVEVYLDDGSTYKATELTDFDRFGNYRSSKLWSNLGAQFDPGLVNVPVETQTSFLPTGTHDGTGGGASGADPSTIEWILGRYDFQEVTEGTKGTARREYCFEGANSTSGPATGFLLGERTLKSTNRSRSDRDVVVKYEKSAKGFPQVERWLGGDLRHNAETTSGWLCDAASSGEAEYEVERLFENGVERASWYRHPSQTEPFLTLSDFTVDRLGNVLTDTDESGVPTTYTYDDRNQIASIQGPTGLLTTIVSSTASRSSLVEQKLGAEVLKHEEYYFDFFGRLQREKRWAPSTGSGPLVAERCTEYMPNSRVKRTSAFASACPNPAGDAGWTRYRFYDPAGKPGEIVGPDGQSTRFTYFGDQATVSRMGVAIGDPDNPQIHIKKVFDRQGQLTRVVENDSAVAGHPVRQTIYEYDVGGNLKEVTVSCRDGLCPAGYQGDQQRRFGYDQRGYLLWQELPELGTSHHQRVELGDYDTKGNQGYKRYAVVDPNRPKGFDLRFKYDRAGRPTQVLWDADGSPLKEYFYARSNYQDPVTQQVDRRAGKLLQSKRRNLTRGLRGENKDIVITETFGYWDVAGRITTRETRSSDGAVFTGHFNYDAANNVKDLIYPTCQYPANCAAALPGRTIRSRYAFSLPTKVEEVTPTSRLLASAIRYFPNGTWREIDHANGTMDSKTLYNEYMPLVGSLSAKRGSTTLWSTGDYLYDGARNVTTIGGDSFQYDTSSQLVQATYAGLGVQTFRYDLYGNLLQLGSRTFTVDPSSNRLLPEIGQTLAYDQAGNLTDVYETERTFDAFNQLSWEGSQGVNRYLLYNADDERVLIRDLMAGKETWSLRSLGNEFLRQVETDLTRSGPWTWKRDHVFANAGLLAAILPDGSGQKVQHYHLDHLNSTRLVTDADGQAQGTVMKYWPYGEVATGALDGPELLRFTGHERDYNCPTAACAGDVGRRDDLDYMHARYGSPWFGRFLSTDRVSGKPEDPASWNRYTFGRNNPMRFQDPDGNDISSALAEKYGRAANAIISAGEDMRADGDSQNDGSVLGIVGDTVLGSAGQIVSGFGDLLNVGKESGTAFGEGKSRDDKISAVARDYGRAGGIALTLVGGAQSIAGRAAPAASTQTLLEGAAARAKSAVGPGRGGAHGTRVHTAFEGQVNSLGRSNLSTEVSYLNGKVVPRGTSGSVRLDVVQGPKNAPTAIYDLKTGSAKLTLKRIKEIQSHLPEGYQNTPVYVVY